MEEEKAQHTSSTNVPSKMRKAWFEFVRKTRVKMSRGQKIKATHREAMKAASANWPAEKAKLIRKHAREAKRDAKK